MRRRRRASSPTKHCTPGGTWMRGIALSHVPREDAPRFRRVFHALDDRPSVAEDDELRPSCAKAHEVFVGGHVPHGSQPTRELAQVYPHGGGGPYLDRVPP